jgi:cytochrome c oxidase assembly protein subunit 11
MSKPHKNTVVVVALLAMVGVMIGIVAVSEPLYRMFCTATGFGGTSRIVSAAPAATTAHQVTVSFDANVDPALPWDFKPEIRSMQVKLGETVTVKFLAHNRSNRISTGTATDNVQPDKAGPYFDKLQCFCFTKQTLKPGQTEELPVQFFVDPALLDNALSRDVQNITLSYTFFPVRDKKAGSGS